MKKRMIAMLVLIGLIISSLVTPVIAASKPLVIQVGGQTYSVAQSEKNGIKTVVVSDGTITSTIVFDGKIMNIAEKNIKTSKTINNSINTTAIATAVSTKTVATIQATTDPGRIVLANTDMWWGYSYAVRQYISSPTKWWLKLDTGAQKTLYENSTNISNLRAYETWVDTMTKDEIACIAAGGSGVAAVIAGILAGPGTFAVSTIIGIAIGLGASATCGYYAYCAWFDSGKCDYYFGICR